MANVKISNLTAATTPVAGTEVLPIVQSGSTVKVSIANLTPGLDTITAAKGGTGQTSYAVGDLLYASTTTALSKLADVATGNALISGGVSTAPSWGKIGLTTHVSGTLPTANGGTNLTSFTANGVVYASSSSALTTGSALVFDGTNLVVGATSSSSQAFRVSQTAFPAVPSGFYCSAGDGAGAYQYGITRVDGTNGRGFQFLSSLGASNLPFYSISVGTAASTIAGMTFSEALRIDSSGNLLVGKTALNLAVGTSIDANTSTGSGVRVVSSASTSSADGFQMYSTGTSTYRFAVGFNGTISAVSTVISSISDARLKENVRDLNVGLSEIMALKPRLYDWKEGKGADIKNARGFIAQEFEIVFPDLIDESRDPAPEGEEPYKAVRADLIPVLVKAIQELKAEFDAYKASHP